MFVYTNSRPSSVSIHQREFKTFDYPSMPSSSMHTGAARNVIVFAGFEPATSCLEWDMCPSYPDLTWETNPDDVPPHHPIAAVFIVSPALSQPKSWHAQSSICKTPGQNSVSLARRDCIHPLHHLVNLSWSLSRPSQRTVSQICAPRFASSVGCKYRRGRVFGSWLRAEKSMRGVVIEKRMY